MDEKLKVGDVVVLKSGSIQMTIETINGNTAGCIWYYEGHFYEKDINILSLEIHKFVIA